MNQCLVVTVLIFIIIHLDDLKSEYIDTGKVRFVFRDFPFNYPALAGSMIDEMCSQ